MGQPEQDTALWAGRQGQGHALAMGVTGNKDSPAVACW